MLQKIYTIRKVVMVVLVAVLLSVMLSACNGSAPTGAVTNSEVINFMDFSADAAEVGLNTRADGTVFVRGDLEKPDDITVEVSIYVAIDPEDWGGIGLYFPEGWRITDAASSVVEIEEHCCSNMVSTMSSGLPEEGGESWVSVGYPLTRAGDSPGDLCGSVVVRADYVWEGKSTPEILGLTVGVGSADGYIVHPVAIDLDVPILDNFRPARVEYYFPRWSQPSDLGEMTHSRQIQRTGT